jgi:hypothetical protein
MDNRNDQNQDVVLWADSQAGKTSALAAYFLHDPQKRTPDWVDWDAPETRETLHFLMTKYWKDLKLNQRTRSTVSYEVLLVKHRDGRVIHFRDMRGANAVDLQSPEDNKALDNAAAVLLCVEWPDQRAATNFLAYEIARSRIKTNTPYALMITKVECYLTLEQVLRFTHSPLEMARQLGMEEGFLGVLEMTPSNRTFPVSVYGYSSNGLPAHYYDEFGRLVPKNIRPYGVAAPFDFLIRQIS